MPSVQWRDLNSFPQAQQEFVREKAVEAACGSPGEDPHWQRSRIVSATPSAAGARPFAGSSCACRPARAIAWPASCGLAARSACPAHRRELRDKNLIAWSRTLSIIKAAKLPTNKLLFVAPATPCPEHWPVETPAPIVGAHQNYRRTLGPQRHRP